jgi:hypothetical protein
MDVDFDPKGNIMGKWSRTRSVRVVRLRERLGADISDLFNGLDDKIMGYRK